MAQPPLSQAIQRLEGDLGVSLLRRTTRRVELTAAGAALLEEARALLEQLDGAVERVRQAARRERGRLVAGFAGATASWFAPEVARVWHERHPELVLDVSELPLEEQLDGVAAGAVDVAFVRPPQATLHAFRHELLAEEQLCAVLPLGHPLADRRRLSMVDLAAETWIAAPAYDALVAEAARAHGFEPRLGERAQSVQTYLSLVAAGVGVGLMSWTAREMRRGELVFVPIDGLTTSLIMVWREERESPEVRALLEVARAAAAHIDSVSKVA
jgi:DNA-binding transcriptional LysR family regulator